MIEVMLCYLEVCDQARQCGDRLHPVATYSTWSRYAVEMQ